MEHGDGATPTRKQRLERVKGLGFVTLVDSIFRGIVEGHLRVANYNVL